MLLCIKLASQWYIFYVVKLTSSLTNYVRFKKLSENDWNMFALLMTLFKIQQTFMILNTDWRKNVFEISHNNDVKH